MSYRLFHQPKGKENRENGAQAVSGHVGPPRKLYRRENMTQHRMIHAKKTLICIYVCGSFACGLGIALTIAGTVRYDSLPNPYIIIGVSCIIVGIFILLLSIEIILKLRRTEHKDRSVTPGKTRKKRANTPEWSKISPCVPDSNRGVEIGTSDNRFTKVLDIPETFSKNDLDDEVGSKTSGGGGKFSIAKIQNKVSTL